MTVYFSSVINVPWQVLAPFPGWTRVVVGAHSTLRADIHQTAPPCPGCAPSCLLCPLQSPHTVWSLTLNEPLICLVLWRSFWRVMAHSVLSCRLTACCLLLCTPFFGRSGKEVWMIFLLGSWDSVILFYCPLCCTENKAGDFHFAFLASLSRRQLGLPFPTSWGLKQHLSHCLRDLMLTSPRCHMKDTSIPPESRGWCSWTAVPVAPVDAIQVSWNHVMGVFVRQKLSACYEVSLKV